MKLLTIDTSVKKFSISVSEDAKIIKYRTFALNRMLSSSIISNINKGLSNSSIPLNKIDAFAVGLGPGSFTSLRIGLSAIKAFALANKKPVIGIPSIDAIALNVSCPACMVCVVSDARRDMLYSCTYKKSGDKIIKKSKYVLMSIKDILVKLENKAVFIGDGIALYKKGIEASGKCISFEPEKLWYPKIKNMVKLAADKCKAKKFDDIDSLIPLYLYPDDCQVHKKINKK